MKETVTDLQILCEGLGAKIGFVKAEAVSGLGHYSGRCLSTF
jgi:hypothetical protein